MNPLLHTIINSLDIVGAMLLIVALVPLKMLMNDLPVGSVRKLWKIFAGLILFFIGAYIFIAMQLRIGDDFPGRDIICIVLFFGAVFVLMVITLSRETALDIKRIYTLEIETITDPLIGISNRRYLEKKLNDEFIKAKRYNHVFSILMLDIDHFKNINDTYGHDAGDIVLKNLGLLLKKLSREFDTIARYGGEEIMIVCPLTDAKDATALAERLRHEIGRRVMLPADMTEKRKDLYITVSIGVAVYTPEISTIEDLVKCADKAMYKAKDEGRNRISLWDGSTCETIISSDIF